MKELREAQGTKLTKREQEVLAFIAEGWSTKQIAGKLFISINTVANHRRNMLRKTGARSSAEMVQYFHNKKPKKKNSH